MLQLSGPPLCMVVKPHFEFGDPRIHLVQHTCSQTLPNHDPPRGLVFSITSPSPCRGKNFDNSKTRLDCLCISRMLFPDKQIWLSIFFCVAHKRHYHRVVFQSITQIITEKPLFLYSHERHCQRQVDWHCSWHDPDSISLCRNMMLT